MSAELTVKGMVGLTKDGKEIDEIAHNEAVIDKDIKLPNRSKNIESKEKEEDGMIV